MNTTFENFIPQNSILRKYIYYFYIDNCNNTDYYKKYSFYPHIYTTLSFYNGRALKIKEGNYHIKQEYSSSILKMLTRQHSIQTVEQSGKVDKIGIVFQPLGLNHFLADTYISVAKHEKQLFQPSNDGLWELNMKNIFSVTGSEERIKLLEKFLLSIYKIKEYNRLYSVLVDLSDVENNQTILQIALKNAMSHRKLNRDFMNELGFTPEMYRMIARFRYAVNQKIIHNNQSNLTEIAHESGYLDQSYMIKTFKKLTGLAPRAFFESGTHLGITDTFWKIDKMLNGE